MLDRRHHVPLGHTSDFQPDAVPLPMEQENGGHRCERGADLQREDGERLPRSPREPPDGKERDDRCLPDHQELPDVCGGSLIGLTGSPEQREVNEHRGKGGG